MVDSSRNVMDSFMGNLNFKDIDINTKPIFDKYARLYDLCTGDMSFSSMLAWSFVYNFRYAESNGYLCIISSSPGIGPFALSPIGPYEKQSFQKAVNFLKAYFSRNGWELRFSLVPEKDAERFRELEGMNAFFSSNRAYSDYIYLADDFRTLPGKKYEDKRRQINWFKKHFRYEYVPLDKSMKEECLAVFDEWCSGRDCSNCYPGCERETVVTLIDHMDVLGCKGALVRVEGQPKAFIVTEALKRDVIVSHLEKADRNIKGLFAYLNQEHYIREYPGFKYINLEEDMGIEGLRKSKLSYHPVRLVDKYEITFR